MRAAAALRVLGETTEPRTLLVSRLGYQPSLDGLRAIAIAAVVSFHAFGWPRDGFLGVDLFFVLSGFLITTLLVQEHEKEGRVSFGAFYARRSLRLLPALIAMLSTYLVVVVTRAVFEGDVDVWAALAGTAAGLTYTLNFLIAFAGADAVPTGVSHLWSLAQEEQFYLLWPPILFIICAGRPRSAFAFAVCVLLLVILEQRRLSADGAPGHRLDWAPDTRSGAILIGCLAGLIFTSSAREPLLKVAKWLFPVAFPLFALLIFANFGTYLYRGPLTLFGICSALIVIRSVDPSAGIRKPLGLLPLAFLGRISYSLYLWHLPVFAAFGIDTNEVFAHRSVDSKIAAILVAVGLATASYYLIELPFLNRKRAMEASAPRSLVPSPSTA